MDETAGNIDSEQVRLTLPSNLVAQIDAQIGGNFVDQEEFIRAAVRHYLEYLRSGSGGNAPTMPGMQA